MKKNLLTSFAGIFLLLVTVIAANGQLASSNMRPSADIDPFGKSILKNEPVSRNEVGSRVVRKFVKSYENVFNEKWFEVSNGFVAMFDLDNIGYQVAYDKKGNCLRTIRSYDEAKLAQDLRHIVKSSYYDYDINLVQEIEKPGTPVTYIIQLLGRTELINLRMCDGEMDVLQKFTRSK